MSSDDRLIPRLLSGQDRLSRVEKDQIFDRAVGVRSRRVRWWWLAAPALAAGLAVVVLAPWRARDEFTARGSSRPIAALRVACPSACTGGSKLLFDVKGTTAYRYFAAFAKRDDGTVLWYFPSEGSATGVDLSQAPASGVLDRGIVLGDEHPAGTYHVYGVFSNAPLTRAAIRDAFDAEHLTAGEGTAVVAADLEVAR